jgi:hypothetical protein
MIEVVNVVDVTQKGKTGSFPLRSFSVIKAFAVRIVEIRSNQNTAQF